MAFKEIPITYRVYYKNLIEEYTQLKANATAALEDLRCKEKALYEDVKSNADRYKTDYNINLFSYKEFVDNKYSEGLFIRVAKGAYINKKNDYVIVADLFDLFDLATKQKEIYNLEIDIAFYNKILALKIKDYHRILQVFYTEVHKKMIIKGYGYAFEEGLGWTCINRCKINKVRPHIDYAATKKKKEEILARGGRIYNKEEEEWCKQNNIEYNGEDCRVFQKLEYCYEIPLIGCSFTDGRKYKLETSDTRGREVRGKSNEDLKQESNGNLEYLCELNVGIKTKLNLCLDVDKTLYTNFIRNENQKPVNSITLDRKNR